MYESSTESRKIEQVERMVGRITIAFGIIDFALETIADILVRGRFSSDEVDPVATVKGAFKNVRSYKDQMKIIILLLGERGLNSLSGEVQNFPEEIASLAIRRNDVIHGCLVQWFDEKSSRAMLKFGKAKTQADGSPDVVRLTSEDEMEALRKDAIEFGGKLNVIMRRIAEHISASWVSRNEG